MISLMISTIVLMSGYMIYSRITEKVFLPTADRLPPFHKKTAWISCR